jgi:hypothetical protein
VKLDYDMQQADDYVDIYVYYVVGERSWQMHLYRDLETLGISTPAYMYSPNHHESFDDIPRLPKRVQAYFDSVMPKVKTLLILGSN